MISGTWEIARHELGVALRTARALWVAAFYLGSSLLGGIALVLTMRLMEKEVLARLLEQGIGEAEAAKAVSLMSEPAFKKLAAFFAGAEASELADAFQTSLIVPFFFWGSLTFLPFLILLTSFDQVSADLQSRSICYTALRASRSSILAGKVLAQSILFIALTALGSTAWLLLATAFLDTFSLVDALPGLWRMTVLLVPFGLCYLAISAFCSCLVRQPFVSLLSAFAIVVGLRVIGWLTYVPEDHALGWLRYGRYLSPTAHHDGLWLGGIWGPLQSTAAYVAFAAVFLALAAWILRRRDL